jgi:hypothetical protein
MEYVKQCMSMRLGNARYSACARVPGDTTVRINIQGTLAIVSWMPMMAGTLAT